MVPICNCHAGMSIDEIKNCIYRKKINEAELKLGNKPYNVANLPVLHTMLKGRAPFLANVLPHSDKYASEEFKYGVLLEKTHKKGKAWRRKGMTDTTEVGSWLGKKKKLRLGRNRQICPNFSFSYTSIKTLFSCPSCLWRAWISWISLLLLLFIFLLVNKYKTKPGKEKYIVWPVLWWEVTEFVILEAEMITQCIFSWWGGM